MRNKIVEICLINFLIIGRDYNSFSYVFFLTTKVINIVRLLS